MNLRTALSSLFVFGAFVLAACSSDDNPAANSSGAGGTASAGAAGTTAGTAGAQAGSAGTGGTGGTGGASGTGGTTPLDIPGLVEQGMPLSSQDPRPAFGALLVAREGDRTYRVESRRDVEEGPFGLPWRSRFRVAAYDADGSEAWAFLADPDDVIGDVVVHPSGEITLSVERFSPFRDAFELVRVSRDGVVIKRAALAPPLTPPESDFGPNDPRPLFRMKSDFADATVAGWVRLIADGEGLAVAFQSLLDVPSDHPGSGRMAIGLEVLDWQSGSYVERWARVIDGNHDAEPAAWAYDELRWREQAIRPFFARDDSSGDFLVGRAWNQLRCEANVSTFGEVTAQECVLGAVNTSENERLPLAITRVNASGARLGTRILRPDADAAEQVPFAIAARDGEIAVVGSVVRQLESGEKKTYPDANGFIDYDGYIGIYDSEGNLLRHHDYNLGRGDVLAALRWTPQGILAVGSSGWDRWHGGMSISRGSEPLFAWLSKDGERAEQRVISLGNGSRHWNLHDVEILDHAIVGVGFSDAPMTHSADAGGAAARTFGPLQIRLEP